MEDILRDEVRVERNLGISSFFPVITSIRHVSPRFRAGSVSTER